MSKKPIISSPNRGEVWLVDLGYTAKVRPCLVLLCVSSTELKEIYEAQFRSA